MINNKDLAQVLAYEPVIRKYIKKKYDVTETELKLLLFIYHKRQFPLRNFYNFKTMFDWEANAFHKMRDKGYMRMVKEASKKKFGVVYGSTKKTDKIVEEFMRLLQDDEYISNDPKVNPIFKRETFGDKMHSHFMRHINREREQRRVLGLYDNDDDEF